ncbi:MAG: hypothetical protein HY689_02365 [Chloroflexi bacterium]|nr:hypothetical protein [Chloroflexota bacterium]
MWQRYRRGLGLAVVGLLAAALLAGGSLVAGTALAGPEGEQTGHGRYAQVFLDKLAALLNVDRDQLVDAMKQAGQQTVDEAVVNGDLTQRQADRVKERIQSGAFPKGPWHFGKARGHHALKGVIDPQTVKTAITQRLGLTTEELQAELRSGKTLRQVAEERGVSVEDLRQTVLDTVEPQLDTAVQEGRITEQQRERILERIRQADGLGMMGMPHGKREGMSMPQGRGSYRGPQFGGSSS